MGKSNISKWTLLCQFSKMKKSRSKFEFFKFKKQKVQNSSIFYHFHDICISTSTHCLLAENKSVGCHILHLLHLRWEDLKLVSARSKDRYMECYHLGHMAEILILAITYIVSNCVQPLLIQKQTGAELCQAYQS